MEYELIWADPATAQLEEIHDYIANDNPRAADRVVAKIMARIEQLRWTPRLGAVYRETGKYAIRKIVSGKYRIFYRIIEVGQRVEILLIWHSARRDPNFEKD